MIIFQMAGYTVICVIVVVGPKFPVRCRLVSLLYILLDPDHLLRFRIPLAIYYLYSSLYQGGIIISLIDSFSDPLSGNYSPFNAPHNQTQREQKKEFKTNIHSCECDGHHNHFFLFILFLGSVPVP